MPYIDFKQNNDQPLRLAQQPKSINGFDDSRAHIVFLMRKNSGTGGVQSHNSRLYSNLSPHFNIERIDWNGPEWGAPFYFPAFYYKSIRNGASMVYCDDGVTSIIGSSIRRRSGKKVVAAVHGLDVILPIGWYQKRLIKALNHLDKIICISRATANRVIERGISPEKIEIVPGSMERDPVRYNRDENLYRDIQKFLGLDLRGKKVLISIGRCVKRKGFDKFITDIFRHLSSDHIYIIISPKLSTPPWIKALRPLMSAGLYHNLLLASGAYTMHDDLVKLSCDNPRIYYLNNVGDDKRNKLLSASDLFIMPNRTVEGDMEGFGLVALEAASRGVPVIATGIEGITDAVIDGHNGYCIPENETGAFLGAINGLLNDPDNLRQLRARAAEFTRANFCQDKVFAGYRRVFLDVISNKGPSL